MNPRQSSEPRGFTILELLAVVATILILAALLLPVLGRAKNKAQRTTCLASLRELGRAWFMYKDDYNDRLVESYPVNNSNSWILGDMTKADEAVNTDLIRAGKLYAYNRDVKIYHCPTDKGVTIDKKLVPTVRSYSMNSFMGGRGSDVPVIPTSAAGFMSFFEKYSDIRRPSDAWVLLDEDERSINDGFFVTDPTAKQWIDFPAISQHRHNFSYGLAFADGHSEIWRHTDGGTYQISLNRTAQANNADLERLARASTFPK
jgi:type II secretory pathway pseudopilin PulG